MINHAIQSVEEHVHEKEEDHAGHATCKATVFTQEKHPSKDNW